LSPKYLIELLLVKGNFYKKIGKMVQNGSKWCILP